MPAKKRLLVELEAPLATNLDCVKLPKSVASPVDAIVTKSIVSTVDGVLPPPKHALDLSATPAGNCLDCDKLPKSIAFAVVAILI